MQFINVSVLILASAWFVFAQGLPQLKNTSGHDIIDGNCSNVTVKDRVYYDHVDKMAFPLIVRSETIKYYGDYEIYCIQAINQKSNETGGTSEITDGGVGHRYVVIQLESSRSHGLEFYVSIYVKNRKNLTVPLLINNQ